jgi:PhzF family phenazine biosynthesis protein
MTYPFQLVDVFGDDPFTGNPLAVVTCPRAAADLDPALMQRITRWLNLSETTFLLPPTDPAADYRVRIFTLARELPFAGHPTLGTAHAWLAAGGTPKTPGVIVQECGAGLVRVRQDGSRLAFAAPPTIRSGAVEAAKLAEIAAVLGISEGAIIDAQWVDNGPGWVAIRLASAEAVLALEPARSPPGGLDLGVVGAYPPGHAAAFEIRALFTDAQGALMEDPVTGSLNASVAQWLIASGEARPPYVVSQGTRLDRRGRVHIDRDAAGDVWVGGRTETLFSGVCEAAFGS